MCDILLWSKKNRRGTRSGSKLDGRARPGMCARLPALWGAWWDISINTCDIIVTFNSSSHPQYSRALCLIDVLLQLFYLQRLHQYLSPPLQVRDPTTSWHTSSNIVLDHIFCHFYFNATGTGQSQLISAVDKVCTRSLVKPHEQWTVSSKVRLRCHNINQYMMETFVAKIIFIIIIMFLNVFCKPQRCWRHDNWGR